MRVSLFFWATAWTAVEAATTPGRRRGWSLPTSRSMMPKVPRGGAGRGRSSSSGSSNYVLQLEAVKAAVVSSFASQLDDLQRQVVDQGKIVHEFGNLAETIINQALEAFASNAPDVVMGGGDGDGPDEDVLLDAAATSQAAAAYDTKLAELETALDAPLQLLFLKQLAYLRQRALNKYKTAVSTTGISELEAAKLAEGEFNSGAAALAREGWDGAAPERVFLLQIMSQMAEFSRSAVTARTKAAEAQQTSMQFLQYQQQMIQQLQMQLYGQSSPWNVGVAYRIPDTNFNLQGSYQQGRANIQLSCVPDEYAPFLGPNGFTNGVGPGNLGLSLNLSV